MDEESGAVVGVMVGTRMDNRVEGVRGWGRPAETIFEVSLTGTPAIPVDICLAGAFRCSVFLGSTCARTEVSGTTTLHCMYSTWTVTA